MALRQTLRWNSIFHINETANILFKLVLSLICICVLIQIPLCLKTKITVQ